MSSQSGDGRVPCLPALQVAELELVVGTAKASRADPVACFELLQKLLVSIDRTERARLKEYGRRCEAALVDILLKGTAPPVRLL